MAELRRKKRCSESKAKRRAAWGHVWFSNIKTNKKSQQPPLTIGLPHFEVSMNVLWICNLPWRKQLWWAQKVSHVSYYKRQLGGKSPRKAPRKAKSPLEVPYHQAIALATRRRYKAGSETCSGIKDERKVMQLLSALTPPTSSVCHTQAKHPMCTD